MASSGWTARYPLIRSLDHFICLNAIQVACSPSVSPQFVEIDNTFNRHFRKALRSIEIEINHHLTHLGRGIIAATDSLLCIRDTSFLQLFLASLRKHQNAT